MTKTSAIPELERFFRATASLDIDKADVERLNDFVFERTGALLLRAEANAKANVRDIIEPWDLPITTGLQEMMHEFESMDEGDLANAFRAHIALPQLENEISDDTREQLPVVAGALSIGLARSMKDIIDTKVKNPSTLHWERAFRLFRMLL